MAPNVESPTEKHSDEAGSQLVDIEKRITQLEQNTLKIKKNNSDIIRGFHRKIPTVAGQYLATESLIKVTEPSQLLEPDVSGTLKGSADVRHKMQDTLKACEEYKKRHRECLEQMTQQLMAVDDLAGASSKPTLSVFDRAKKLFRLFKKTVKYPAASDCSYNLSNTENTTAKSNLRLKSTSGIPIDSSLEQITNSSSEKIISSSPEQIIDTSLEQITNSVSEQNINSSSEQIIDSLSVKNIYPSSEQIIDSSPVKNIDNSSSEQIIDSSRIKNIDNSFSEKNIDCSPVKNIDSSSEQVIGSVIGQQIPFTEINVLDAENVSPNRTSSLCSGVPIRPLQVSVTAWSYTRPIIFNQKDRNSQSHVEHLHQEIEQDLNSLANIKCNSELEPKVHQDCPIDLKSPEDVDKPPPTGSNIPPPPPAIPLAPLYLDSKKSAWKNLPITPLDNNLGIPTIFDAIQPIEDVDQVHLNEVHLKFIEDNFKTAESSTYRNKRISINEDKTTTKSPNQSKVSLLSDNRRNMILIGMKKLKGAKAGMEVKTILAALRTMDVDKLNIDDIQILLQMLPKDDEKTIYECLDDKKCETLCQADKIIKSLLEIPRVSIKLEAMNYMMNFDETSGTILTRINILKSAAQSVMKSENFKTVIQCILMVINKAFVKDEKPLRGFQINSLQRLSSKKSANGKFTLLYCIAMFIESKFPDAVHFYNDFVGIEDASKISKTDVDHQFKELEAGLDMLRQEIQKTESDGEAIDCLTKAMDFSQKSSAKLNDMKKDWQASVAECKKVTEYFGMSEEQSTETPNFFAIILKFVSDYKMAKSESNILSKSTIPNDKEDRPSAGLIKSRNSGSCNDLLGASVKRRSPTRSSKDFAKRSSLGTVLTEILPESEQSEMELMNVLSNFCQFDIRQRGRQFFHSDNTKTNLRKSNKNLNGDSNRERQ